MASTSTPVDGVRPRSRLLLRVVVGAVLVGMAAAGVGVVNSLAEPEKKLKATAPPPVDVEVLVIRPIAELPDTLQLPGTVQPRRVVSVAAEVTGRIEKIHCREGQRVRRGQLLVSLNKDLLGAELRRARAQAEFDAREVERVLSLRQRGVETEFSLDQARTKAKLSQAVLAAAEANFQRCEILSPLDGVLDGLPMEEGEHAAPDKTVAKIVDLDTVKVVVAVPERDVPHFRVGAQAKVLAGDGRVRSLTGTIAFISELADAATRTTRMEIAVDNRAGVLRSGQFVRAVLTRRVLSNAIMIPLEAVVPLEDSKAAYVEAGGLAVRRTVEMGMLRGTGVRILSGLAAGDRLIVKGHRYVGPGQAVRVVAERAGPATAPASAPATAPATAPAELPPLRVVAPAGG